MKPVNAQRWQRYRQMSTAPVRLLAVAALLSLAACGSVKLVARTNIPAPLVTRIPVAVAVYMPKEFSGYVHKEKRWSTDWNIDLGKAQADGMNRLFGAMFERVVEVESINAGAQLGGDIRAILEPSVEEYAFVTPRDAGSPFYAVSIKYRVNVYAPDGRLADSWGFTGYGTWPSEGLSNSVPLTEATALAMRDAGAKLAVEFRDQAVVRGLLPDAPPATSATPSESTPPPATPAAEAPAAPAEAPAPSKEESPVPAAPPPSI